jgi:hypothetical protein
MTTFDKIADIVREDGIHSVIEAAICACRTMGNANPDDKEMWNTNRNVLQRAYDSLVDPDIGIDTDKQIDEMISNIPDSEKETARKKYTGSRRQFVMDFMNSDKYELRHYRGRMFYEGPSVVVDRDDLSDALSQTTVKCQWDNLGHDWVVYPK